MASPTPWKWVWASSGIWWWTGKPGTLQSVGSQRVRHDWVTDLILRRPAWVVGASSSEPGPRLGSQPEHPAPASSSRCPHFQLLLILGMRTQTACQTRTVSQNSGHSSGQHGEPGGSRERVSGWFSSSVQMLLRLGSTRKHGPVVNSEGGTHQHPTLTGLLTCLPVVSAFWQDSPHGHTETGGWAAPQAGRSVKASASSLVWLLRQDDLLLPTSAFPTHLPSPQQSASQRRAGGMSIPGPRPRHWFQVHVFLWVCESLSPIQLLVTPWTVARQASLPTEFSRQEYWSGLPFPLPGILPDPGRETESPTLQAHSLPSEPPGNPIYSFSSKQSPYSFSLWMLFWTLYQLSQWKSNGKMATGWLILHARKRWSGVWGLHSHATSQVPRFCAKWQQTGFCD